MNKIFIGDFQCKALQQLSKIDSSLANDHQYIVNDLASYSWFATDVIYKLEKLSPVDSNIVIMLGILDCINSCIFGSTFKIDSIVADYSNLITKLQERYPTCKFYFCSINPVNGDYSHVFAKDGLVTCHDLTEKIKAFNEQIKFTCKGLYIDSYEYLTRTNFSTYDGVHYTQSTLEALYNFITNILVDTSSNIFTPRLAAPVICSGDDADPMDDFWISTEFGGENPFPLVDNANGSTLPNCTAYAWGRFYEILGSEPTLSLRNAENWWAHTNDGYKRGETPALGAIICWRKGEAGNGDDGAGHVAVVEQINDDGSIVTSESGWEANSIWWLKTRTNDNGNWGAGNAYTFQGFIYCPTVVPTPTNITVTKADVTSVDESLTEKKYPGKKAINAQYIWKFLGSRGWTLNAVAALLGNMEHESSINPGRGEVGGSGYGLVQWTGRSKLMKWCDAQNPPLLYDDIDSQLLRIEHERFHGYTGADKPDDIGVHTPKELREAGCSCGQYSYATKDGLGYKYASTYGPKTFYEFSKSEESPYHLACAFLYNYERPASIIYGASSKSAGLAKTAEEREAKRKEKRDQRGKSAEEWYTFLVPYANVTTFSEKAIIDSLSVYNVKPTSVTASFIERNCVSCTYTVLNDKEETVIPITSLTDQLGGDNLSTVIFKLSGLEPNNTYILQVDATSENDDELFKAKEFTTPQDYPALVKNIELTCKDTIKHTNSKFNLKIIKPDYLGYWGADSGYDIQLFINNKCIKTLHEDVTDISWNNFTVKEKFGYTPKTGDTIQIGVLTWVKDSNGVTLYNENVKVPKVSKPICLLNKPIQVYLNR